MAKIQHLHSVATDLNFKASQQGQNLVAKAMEMYQHGTLAQGELTTICHQIATYQQQLSEIQEELQRLQSAEGATPQQAAPVPAAPTGYPGYPPPRPGIRRRNCPTRVSRLSCSSRLSSLSPSCRLSGLSGPTSSTPGSRAFWHTRPASSTRGRSWPTQRKAPHPLSRVRPARCFRAALG